MSEHQGIWVNHLEFWSSNTFTDGFMEGTLQDKCICVIKV
jgi:hypothetical protein